MEKIRGFASMAMVLSMTMLLVSCSGGAKDDAKVDSQAEPKAAREIMKEYTNTLATAPDKARAVRTQVETRSEDALKDFE